MTWSEKLIAEWLEMKGYHVRVGVPLGSKNEGGRGDADVLGLKMEEGHPHILWVEVGDLNQSADNDLNVVKERKFTPENKKYILDSMGLPEDTSFESRFIAPYMSTKGLLLIRENGFKIDKLEEVFSEIFQDIKDWAKKEGKRRRTSEYSATPPNKLDLICLLDFLIRHDIKLPSFSDKKKKGGENV